MNQADWQKIKAAFNEASDLTDGARQDFLAGLDADLKAAVEGLLTADESSQEFISQPAMVELGLADDPNIGSSIGEYEIVRQIGAGGMGKVYLAGREGFDEFFALKLIKRGMDTDALLERFDRERRILSRLSHPNIARLLNAGSTKTGLPFFVMEYVDGESITAFCQSNQLSTDSKLELFQRVCSAVAFAHQNLIVHRDLKPSNILVTKEGVPKLLDFGIAKLLSDDSKPDDFTAAGARMLTPQYASPEQLTDSAITTASDIYSLGVILHELLCGSRPVSSVNRQTDATHPNKSVTESDRSRTGSEPESLHQIPGDIGNILAKAIRSEPERRYATVNELSEDIGRYLSGLPVSATADSRIYRLKRFLKRNRREVTIGSAVAAVFLLLAMTAVWQGIIATRERNNAEARFEELRKLANIVLFEYHDGITNLPGATAMREKMVTDSLSFLDTLSKNSGESADLKRDIAKAYRKVGAIQGGSDAGNTGKTQESLDSYRKALAILQTAIKDTSATLDDRRMLANLNFDIAAQMRSLGDTAGAQEWLNSGRDIFQAIAVDLPADITAQSDLAKAFWNLASFDASNNRLDSALGNYQNALKIYRNLSETDSANFVHIRNVALTNKYLGGVLQVRGEYDSAIRHFNESLEIDTANLKRNPNNIAAKLDLSYTFASLASVQRTINDFPSAIENYRAAIKLREEVFSADANNKVAEGAVARGYLEVGRTNLQKGSLEQAEQDFKKALIIYRAVAAADPQNTLKKLQMAGNIALLGQTVGLNGRLAESEEHFGTALAMFAAEDAAGRLRNLDKKSYAVCYLDFAKVLIKLARKAAAMNNLNRAEQILSEEAVKKDASAELETLKALSLQAQALR